MIFIPFSFFFIIIMFRGIFISISSCSWLYVWIGLEINLMSFIPLIICGSNDIESERAVKYFLVQALGSCIILFSYFLFIGYFNYLYIRSFYNYLIIFSLMLKIGIFPFHHWLPHIINGSRWFICFLLSVVQKVAPSFIMCFRVLGCRGSFILLLGSIGSLFGGINGLNQRQLRMIMAYSSIGHLGWIFCSIYYSFFIFIYYYLIYIFINFRVIILLIIYPLKTNNINTFNYIPTYYLFFLCFSFISLAGLPPFLGFYSKLLVIFYIVNFNQNLYCFFLITGSLINLFYYLSIFFNIFLISSFKNFYTAKYNGLSLISFLVCFSISITYLGFGILYLLF